MPIVRPYWSYKMAKLQKKEWEKVKGRKAKIVPVTSGRDKGMYRVTFFYNIPKHRSRKTGKKKTTTKRKTTKRTSKKKGKK